MAGPAMTGSTAERGRTGSPAGLATTSISWTMPAISSVEDAGSGIDLVQASVSLRLGANVENLTLTGTAAINGTGNELNNVITGNGGANAFGRGRQ
jgi:hypothetical protein